MATTPAWRGAEWQVKLQRAREHLGTFEGAVNTFLAIDPYSLREEVADGGQAHILYLVDRGQPPPRLSAIVGDILHNTRSALDCLVYTFAERGAGQKLTEQEAIKLQFPISDTAEGFERELRNGQLTHVSDQAVETIRSLQPYHHEAFRKPLRPLT